MMIMKPCAWNYLQKIVHLLPILQIFKHLFSGVNSNYNLRSQPDFRVPGINIVSTLPIQSGILDQ